MDPSQKNGIFHTEHVDSVVDYITRLYNKLYTTEIRGWTVMLISKHSTSPSSSHESVLSSTLKSGRM